MTGVDILPRLKRVGFLGSNRDCNMNMSSYIPYPGVDAPTPDVYSRVLVAGFGKSEKPVTNRIGENEMEKQEKPTTNTANRYCHNCRYGGPRASCRKYQLAIGPYDWCAGWKK